MDYVVVTPDDPLCLGLVDLLAARGIPASGPDQAAARIEGSKVFAKDLMRRYGIPTARYETFDDGRRRFPMRAHGSVPRRGQGRRLALGKGVLICETNAQAEAAVIENDEKRQVWCLLAARVVVEEFLEGPEVSVLCFTDGTAIRPMASSMDHKRAGRRQGLNTGGMGVIAPNPYYTPPRWPRAAWRRSSCPRWPPCARRAAPLPRVFVLRADDHQRRPEGDRIQLPLRGPETQAVLPLLESDLFAIMRATTEGTLAQADVCFRDGASCCVVLASGGYPEKV